MASTTAVDVTSTEIESAPSPSFTNAPGDCGHWLRHRCHLGRACLTSDPLVDRGVRAALPAIPYAMGIFPSPVLPSGPFLAAVITAAIVGGRTGLRSFFRRLILTKLSSVAACNSSATFSRG